MSLTTEMKAKLLVFSVTLFKIDQTKSQNCSIESKYVKTLARFRSQQFFVCKRKAQNIFFNLEKRNHVKKHIRKLCINGKITTDPHCILKEQERFYRELYKSSINSPNIGEKKIFIFERSNFFRRMFWTLG